MPISLGCEGRRYRRNRQRASALEVEGVMVTDRGEQKQKLTYEDVWDGALSGLLLQIVLDVRTFV